MAVTYYETLQIATTATNAVIQASYRALVKLYHPDVNKDPQAVEIFRSIQHAYEVLSDPQRRAAYDIEIGIAKTQPIDIRSKLSFPFSKDLVGRLIGNAISERKYRWVTYEIYRPNNIGSVYIYVTDTGDVNFICRVKPSLCEPNDFWLFSQFNKIKLDGAVYVDFNVDEPSYEVAFFWNIKTTLLDSVLQSLGFLRFIEIIENSKLDDLNIRVELDRFELMPATTAPRTSSKPENTNNESFLYRLAYLKNNLFDMALITICLVALSYIAISHGTDALKTLGFSLAAFILYVFLVTRKPSA